MFPSLTALLYPRSSSETARSYDSQASSTSTRSYRLAASNCTPPSIDCGSQTRPHIELQKPVWDFDAPYQSVSVTGEVDVDISMFQHGPYTLPFSIGIHFTALSTPSASSANDDSDNTDDEDESPGSYSSCRGEWNQDGPGNYYRSKSFISIEPRVVVDCTCSVRFSIQIPCRLLPSSKNSRVYNVSMKAYELGNPDNVTETGTARFMVLNRIPRPVSQNVAFVPPALKPRPADATAKALRCVSDLASQMNTTRMRRMGRTGKCF